MSSFKLRQIQLSRSYRGAVEETEAFSIDLLAIERCRDCDNNQLKSSINILVVKRCRVAVELFARRCRAICPQVSSYLSSSNEHSGGATLGPKGALPPPPPKIFEKKYIYSRVILIKKCYIYNIFIINLK